METDHPNGASLPKDAGKIRPFQRKNRRRRSRFRCRRQRPVNDFKMECVVCQATFSGLVPFFSHLNTRHHKMTQLIKDDDPQWLSSISDIKTRMQNLIQQFEPDEYGEHYCEYCDKKNTGVVPLMQHFRTWKHIKHVRQAVDKMNLAAYCRRVELSLMEEEQWMNGIYECKLCRMTLKNKSQLKWHKQSKKHYRNKNKIKYAKEILNYFNKRYPF